MNAAIETISIDCTQTKKSSYPVAIGASVLHGLKKFIEDRHYSSVIAFFDPNVVRHPLSEFIRTNIQSSVMLPHFGEAIKNFESLQWIIQHCMQHRLDRKSVVVAVGGGAVGDAVSFAASLYMRGVSVIQIPTTLLAMVDSSVGGKTAINVGPVKNLIGSFQHPDAVFIEPRFLSTLPEREFLSGTAEIIKHAFIRDDELIPLLLDQRLKEAEMSTLTSIITRSVKTKKEIVQEDPTEEHVRKILNFGHTVGHALERCSHETTAPLLHGEAVFQGMLLESLIASKLKKEARSVFEVLVRLYRFQGISTEINELNEDKLINAMLLDKKNHSGKLRFSLCFQKGLCEFDQEVSRELVLDVYREALQDRTLLF